QATWPPRYLIWVLLIALAFTGGLLTARVTDWVRGPTNADAQTCPKVYTLVEVTKPRPLLGPRLSGEDDFDDYRRTQAALVKSRFVLNAALRDPKVAHLASLRAKSDPLEWMADQVRVDFAPGPTIMRIGMDGDNFAELSLMVNAIRDAYLREAV